MTEFEHSSDIARRSHLEVSGDYDDTAQHVCPPTLPTAPGS